MATCFISHASSDKPFAKKLGNDLKDRGHKVWLDAWEIKVGQSIPSKIEEGLNESDFVLVILSESAIASKWVEREWKAKFWDQINHANTYVLPCLIEKCAIPTLLKGIKYANFEADYTAGLSELIDAISPITADISATVAEVLKATAQPQKIAKLLSKAHAGEHALSSCIAEGLELAHEVADADLERFCREELTGIYPDSEDDKTFAARVKWRVIEAYLRTDGELNLSYMGFQTARELWAYIRSHPKDFVPIRFVYNFALPEIERKFREVSVDTRTLTLTRNLSNLVGKPKTPDPKVTIYLPPNVCADLIENIRGEFVQRLLKLMPVVPTFPR